MTNKTTFQDFIGSAKKVADLRKIEEFCIEHDEAVPGWVYLDSFYIEQLNLKLDKPFNVVLGSGEYLFDNLPDAETFLWDEFAFLELNCGTFDPCRFYFGDDPTWDGYTDNSTWNGFDNVLVTEKVHKEIVAHFDADYRSMGYAGDDLKEAMDSFLSIKPDEFRLYDYGNGFATSIDEDHYHSANR